MKLLAICLLTILSTQAWGSRAFWLRTYGQGSLAFWKNKYLPNTDNICRYGAGSGSRLFWESCTYDPDNPTQLLPGTRANWLYGEGPGTKRYWESAISVPPGVSHNQMCTSPNGYRSGMKLYYTHCTGPGSKAYWEAGSNRGSLIYWTAGTERSISPDWVGPCMTGLDTVWCNQMRMDQVLQTSSILDWIANVPPAENQYPCGNLEAIIPGTQQSLTDIINASMRAAGQIFDSATMLEP